MSVNPIEALEALAADVNALRRTVESKVMNKEQALGVQEAIERWGSSVDRTMADVRSSNIDLERQALQIATEASKKALASQMEEMRMETLRAAQSYSEAAGEARKTAWQYFGGFWVWLTSAILLGALIGFSVHWYFTARGDAFAFGENPSFYCEIAGGQKGAQDDGREYCVFWLKK